MVYLALSRRAIHDLEEIELSSTEKWGRKVADAYLDSIEEALLLLQENSNLLKSKGGLSKHFSFYRVREHFLICSMIEKRIYVLAVRYAGMDLPNRIGELEPTLTKEAAILHQRCLRR